MWSATSDARSAPKKQRKVMTLQEVELLDMYHRLRCVPAVAYYFKLNESREMITVNIHEAVAAALPAGTKTLHLLQNILFSCIETAA